MRRIAAFLFAAMLCPRAARAKPDGNILLLNHMGMSTIPLLYKQLNFDPLTFLEFVGLFAEAPMVILARKDFAPTLDQARPEAHRRMLASQIDLWRPIIE